MRVLTVLSGIVLSGAGAFCFAFYTTVFSSLAFLVGMAMLVSGLLTAIAYIISGKGGDRLTETALVEGVVTIMYGLSVLNNQVGESMITIYFGTWIALCGISRFAQSICVSRYNAKSWAKLLPLAFVAAILGLIMMMPQIVSAASPVMLLAASLVINGLSLISFAMYMKKRETKEQRAIEAAQRAENRKLVAEEKRAERDALRNMNKEERKAAKAESKKAKKAKEEAAAAQLAAQKAARAQARNTSLDDTISFTPQQMDEIAAAAAAFEAADQNGKDADVDNKASEPVSGSKDNSIDTVSIEAEPAAADVKTTDESDADASAVQKTGADDVVLNVRPVWKKPTEIPSLRSEAEEEPEIVIADTPVIKAVNLEELESAVPNVEFDTVKLPEVKFDAKGGEVWQRSEILSDLDNIKLPEKEKADYKPLSLDDLFPETPVKRGKPNEELEKRFTQTLTFHWDEVDS